MLLLLMISSKCIRIDDRNARVAQFNHHILLLNNIYVRYNTRHVDGWCFVPGGHTTFNTIYFYWAASQLGWNNNKVNKTRWKRWLIVGFTRSFFELNIKINDVLPEDCDDRWSEFNFTKTVPLKSFMKPFGTISSALVNENWMCLNSSRSAVETVGTLIDQVNKFMAKCRFYFEE